MQITATVITEIIGVMESSGYVPGASMCPSILIGMAKITYRSVT